MTSVEVFVEFDLIPEIIAGMETRTAAVIAEGAHEIEAQAKAAAPIRTGALRRSINASPEDALTWVVVVGMYYGIYQEFGTYKMAAHPFLIPAATAVLPTIVARLAAELFAL